MIRSRPLRRRQVRLLACAAAALTVTAPARADVAAAALHTAAPAPRTPAIDDMPLLDQRFNVPVDGDLDLVVGLPMGVETSDVTADARIVVTSYRVVADRAAFLAATEGDLPRTEDSFDITLGPPVDTGGTVDPTGAPQLASITGDGTLALRVPTESSSRTGAALQMAQPGVHPVVVELRVGSRRYTTITFVNRLPSPDDERTGSGTMSIGLLMSQTTPPTVEGDATVTVDDAGIAELQRLADGLTAIDAVPAGLEIATTSVPPRAVAIEPETLRALGAADPELAARLAPALAAGDVIARPRLPLDVSAAAADTTGVATPLYTRWLREGEDLLDELLPSTVVDRSIDLVDRPLTEAGAVLRRNLGTRLLVMPFDLFAATQGSTGLLTDTTQLVTVGLADGSSLPTAVIDPYLGERITAGTGTPVSTAIDVVADLLVMARAIDDSGSFVNRHGMVVAGSDLGVPDAAVLGNLTSLLLTTPGLRLVDPVDIGTIVDTWLIDGRPVVLTLPRAGELDLTDRFELVERTATDVAAYASMLPDGDPTAERWSTVVDTMPTTAITDDDAAGMARRLEAEIDVFREGIVVDASSFTLTGRSSLVRFALENTTDTELRVRVSLSSPKIRFPDGDQLVTLAPRSITDVKADAVALSNGTSSVFLRVFAPTSAANVEVVPEVVLTARVTSFAGAGQLVTGAALLFVATWWARHWRQSRRAVLASRNMVRHPASSTDRRTGQGSDELSPDAAASSLPPS